MRQAATDLRLDRWEPLREDARAVRFAVFVTEQQIPIELEWDDMDEKCWHAVLYVEDLAVATGRLLPDGHIGRMAVLSPYRGHGYGALVLSALTAKAAELGYPEVLLNAQLSAEGFYARDGFAREGEMFIEAGIEHITMRKALGQATDRAA